jgi:DNA invertase Pin-like site-specific DNA recombinase
MTKPHIHCAVYTRKSSEEGLEQSFNSLEAQREACIAYISSQKHEGWVLVKDHYDDGGFSGGSMERPALQRLLIDISAGNVQTVIVYKVDRLTRSLADFAKIIEVFDSHGVSFVSVTQQFNTTTSMGRLTLNVLLSFAQFERELTGERIRDKVAASKKRGMWMGGVVPMGYDCVAHLLIVNQPEAETVREIFGQYLRLGCVNKLRSYLEQRQIRSKVRTSAAGQTSGGATYSRGALYHLLNNRSYIGEIVHRGQSYPGQHEAIVPRELWDQVASRLQANNQAHRSRKSHATPSLLSGIVFDPKGVRFTPTHAVKNGKRYRYYTSQTVIQQTGNGPVVARFPDRKSVV